MGSDVIGKFFIGGAEDAIGSSAFLACAVLLAVALSGAACAADVAKVAEPCAACHGEGGVSTEADVPTIAGYSEEYFTQSMDMYMNADRPCVETEYRSGSRKGLKTSMCEVVKGLGEGDIQLMAEYFARQKFVPTVQAYDAEWAKTGKVIHETKCDECHSDAGREPDDNAGMLGGQKMSYLREQIGFVREGKRFTSKKMKRRLDALGNAEIEALVNYYGSIRE
jgi:sulfide dehydrogenase cytochrome subunit